MAAHTNPKVHMGTLTGGEGRELYVKNPIILLPMGSHEDQGPHAPMGDYLRRMKSKTGPAGATTATAHKIAVVFYTMVKKQVQYDASIWAERDAERERRFAAKLKRQAQQLGYKLVPIEEKPAA